MAQFLAEGKIMTKAATIAPPSASKSSIKSKFKPSWGANQRKLGSVLIASSIPA